MKFVKAPDSAGALADSAREFLASNPAAAVVLLVVVVALVAAYAVQEFL